MIAQQVGIRIHLLPRCRFAMLSFSAIHRPLCRKPFACVFPTALARINTQVAMPKIKATLCWVLRRFLRDLTKQMRTRPPRPIRLSEFGVHPTEITTEWGHPLLIQERVGDSSITDQGGWHSYPFVPGMPYPRHDRSTGLFSNSQIHTVSI